MSLTGPNHPVVDWAQSDFQIAVAHEHGRIVETLRIIHTPFERGFANRSVRLVIAEAHRSALPGVRWLNGLSIKLRLFPAQCVRACVRRARTDATDATDAAALLEAAAAPAFASGA